MGFQRIQDYLLKVFIKIKVNQYMKTNFGKHKSVEKPNTISEIYEKKGTMTDEEFEKFIIESGARGSFMIYRSKNKDEELGLDEL